MARDGRAFWKALERRLPAGARGRERDVARPVFLLLRHRIRPEEAQHVMHALPPELKELWAMPGVGVAEEHTGRPIAELDHNEFVGWVRDIAQLRDMAEAAHATRAVFAAVREVLPAEEREHVEHQLPAGLKELWRGERGDGAGPHREQGPSPFWQAVTERLHGRVRAGTSEVARAVLAHLRGRLPPDLAERVGAALPPDIRADWVGPEPGSEADELPERFFGRIAGDLGLTDLDAARHAAAAALTALREMLPPELGDEVARALPEEIRGAWGG
ncbi:MAG TPA: DUF2267 domain-containing protein [Longimicrobiales bacterium]